MNKITVRKYRKNRQVYMSDDEAGSPQDLFCAGVQVPRTYTQKTIGVGRFY